MFICRLDTERPVIREFPKGIKYQQVFVITFTVRRRVGAVAVNMLNAPFVTHSYAQGQRMVKLTTAAPVRRGTNWSVQVTAVPGNTIVPPAWYMVFVVQNGVPSKGVWIKQNNLHRIHRLCNWYWLCVSTISCEVALICTFCQVKHSCCWKRRLTVKFSFLVL